MQVWAWGESGNSGSSVGGTHAGAGSGAGAVGGEPALGGLVPGLTVLTVTIGTGGTGTDTTVTGGSVTVTGAHGQSGSGITPGSGGAAGTNTVAYAGGNGAAPPGSSGGGGGGSAGSTGAGGPGSGAAGGAAGTGAAGPPSLAGVAGGAGGLAGAQGTAGTAPGGGAGGPGNSATRSANPGAPGQVIIIWSVITISPAGYAGFSGVVATAKQAVTAVKGYLGFAGGPPRVVNQWSGTFAQPSSFGPMPPALQSTVIALTPASLVGGGTGYPSAGNWLFAIAGWNQSGLTPVTFGAADDIHSFWRPGDVTASNWAVSPLAGNTRTSIWYTANLARQPGDEYAAPSGVMAGMAVTVIEVAGLGPWDTVTGIFANYAAAAESLNLALAAPASTAFLLAAACGDSSAAGQALAPAGWAPLHAVTASNGTDHTCDAVLTAAVITTTGSVSVNATASSPTDLSGVIIGVQVNAPSPIGAGANPAWPGRLICEAAFGSGYETPPDEMMWTPLTDTQWPSPWNGSSAQFKRAWAWSDRSGIPWGLGQYQSAAGAVTWDNSDGWLTPANVGSGFYFSPAALNVNPSFQSGVYPWTATGGAALAQSSAQVFATADSGLPQYSAMITPNGTTANPGAISEKKAVSAGSPYTDSAWFWSAAAWAAGAQVVISWYNSGGSLISASSSATVPVPAAAWTQVTLLDQAAPAGAVTAAVTVQFAGTPPASQVFWVAEAVLVPGASLPQTGCVTAGNPVRLRMALGTITGPSGTVTYNRWYCWQRNAQSWPETRKPSLRNLVQASLSEVWQSAPGICPTPYRGEVAADSPGWWWPCDDQPLSGGVLPTSLRNAATGSSAVLNIVPSPAGVTAQDAYCSGIGAGAGGTDITTSLSSGFAEPSVATYNVGQLAGWMYGDPQVSPASAQSGNPVTAQPGSAAWQQSGGQGNTGSNGFVLIANDNFPPIASGVTVTGWFRAGFLGTASSVGVESIGYYNVAGQPYAPMTLAALYTNTGPVALLQLATTTGHLTLTTYNGGTPATVTIYSASDLRCNASFRVTLKLTQATYAVLVNGGLTASASGSCTISASAWQWLLANGDLGTNGGSLAATGLVHGGNLAVSHLKVFTGLLPAYRELAQYSAAITGCGVLPAPSSVAAAQVLNEFASGMTPDGTEYQGSYGSGGGTYGLSALAASVAGSYTSGTGARSACAGKGYSDPSYGAAVSVTWAALAPLVQVYTASGAGTETEASACLGAGDSFTGGYGASASGHGVSHVSSGTGASPPSGPSALGDTVGQRIERALGYAKITVPMRAVDQPAGLVKAALDVGGAQCGASVQNIVSSDNGWFFTDLLGVMCYRGRAHLNSDTVAWHIGMNVAAGDKPFAGDVNWDNSPERVFTAITVQPYSPDGATLAELVPSGFAAVNAAQSQFGPRPLNVNSYLQSTSSQQSQADWLFGYYGAVRRRGAVITIDAASHPAAWGLVLAANIGDLVQTYDAPLGSPPMTVTYRISYATRQMSFGAAGQPPVAKVTLVLDPVPPAGYWA